jgi:(2R)-3-sulfolactate dehydrogenase (NADP+)
MTDKLTRVTTERARVIATAACLAAGADVRATHSLVEATLSAAQFGRTELGFPHLLDYLAALRAGRIKGDARPHLTYPLPAVIASDARGGIAQLGFDWAYDDLCSRAQSLGIALFTQRNSFTTGELGYYVRRLSLTGLLGLAVTNGPALMAAAPGQPAVYCTNPMAFGVPMPQGAKPLVIDQASSSTAFLNLRRAAEAGETIPEGWAIDRSGRPTTDAKAALEGALLPFGGYKGANVALLVELLSAGLSGAAWSLDAPSFAAGDRSPDCGLTVIALAPLDAGSASRAATHLQRLQGEGVSIPSQREQGASDVDTGSVLISETLLRQLENYPGAVS